MEKKDIPSAYIQGCQEIVKLVEEAENVGTDPLTMKILFKLGLLCKKLDLNAEDLMAMHTLKMIEINRMKRGR